jgi:hypothetical protein
VQYDLLVRHYVPSTYLYDCGGRRRSPHDRELGTWVPPVVLTVGTMGAISVFKEAYIVKRDLNCARVGGGSSVLPGFISLAENLIMMGMALAPLLERAANR